MAVHCNHDCLSQCTTRAQRAVSLRLGPQVQTLLSRKGRPGGERRAGQSCCRSPRSIARGACIRSGASAKAGDTPTLEGDHARLRAASADAAQNRELNRMRARFRRGYGDQARPRDLSGKQRRATGRACRSGAGIVGPRERRRGGSARAKPPGTLVVAGARVFPWELTNIRDQLPHVLILRAFLVAPRGHARHPHAVRNHVVQLGI